MLASHQGTRSDTQFKRATPTLEQEALEKRYFNYCEAVSDKVSHRKPYRSVPRSRTVEPHVLSRRWFNEDFMPETGLIECGERNIARMLRVYQVFAWGNGM